MEWTAQVHLGLAQKLKTRLEVDLDNFILEQKDKRKLAYANIEKVHRYKVSSEAYLAKVKEKYESDCAKLYTIQAQLSNTAGREADRMKQKIDRTQQEIKVQEQEYRNACIKLADATDQWNKAWKMTCDTYQGMEKKRLEFLHHSFSMYINVLSTASNQDLESYERFWKTLDNYNVDDDIQTLVRERGTGPMIPEPEEFVDYLDDPLKNENRYIIANFDQSPLKPADPELHIQELPSKPFESMPIKYKPTETYKPDQTKTPSTEISENKSVPTKPDSKESSCKPKLTVRNPTVSKPLPSTRPSTRKPPKKQDQDIQIDPRAKVVFSVGNNMFDLGHLSEPPKPKPFARRTTVRHRPDLEAPINFSYQSLLEELGIFETVKPLFWAHATQNVHSQNPSELNYTKGTRLAITDTSRKDGWYHAIKYDQKTGSLTQEKGLVSHHCIQKDQ